MTRPDIDTLAALLDKATPGVWELLPQFPYLIWRNDTPVADFGGPDWGNDNAALVVAAVNALPALLSYIAELERDAERYRWLRANWTTMSSIATRSALKFELGVKPWADFSGDVIDAAIDSAREGDNA